jgi:translation initiation factor IF-2
MSWTGSGDARCPGRGRWHRRSPGRVRFLGRQKSGERVPAESGDARACGGGSGGVQGRVRECPEYGEGARAKSVSGSGDARSPAPAGRNRRAEGCPRRDGRSPKSRPGAGRAEPKNELPSFRSCAKIRRLSGLPAGPRNLRPRYAGGRRTGAPRDPAARPTRPGAQSRPRRQALPPRAPSGPSARQPRGISPVTRHSFPVSPPPRAPAACGHGRRRGGRYAVSGGAPQSPPGPRPPARPGGRPSLNPCRPGHAAPPASESSPGNRPSRSAPGKESHHTPPSPRAPARVPGGAQAGPDPASGMSARPGRGRSRVPEGPRARPAAGPGKRYHPP